MTVRAPEVLSRLIDLYPGCVHVLDLVHDRSVFTNLRWQETFGYSPEETQAASFLTTIVLEEDLPLLLDHHATLRRATDDEQRTLEYRVRRRDGSIASMRTQDCPFTRDSDGAVTSIVSFAQEITAQKEAAARRDRESTFHQAIIENAVEGICVCEDCDSPPGIHFSVWNARMTEISGYTVDEINILGWYQTVYADEETRARAADRMARMRQGEDLAAEEWTISRKDGERRILLISTRVIVTDRPRVLGVMHDVTERVMLEQRVRLSERLEAIGRLAGAVAHDFNNILAAIRCGASVLARTPDLSDRNRSIAQDIEESAVHGSELTQQLLTFGRRQRTDLRPLNLGRLVEDTLRMVQRLLAGSIVLETDLAPDCFVNGDPALLEQVVMNLVLNARDAMPDGGRLVVAVQSPTALHGEAELTQLSVHDTGKGISDADLPHIFEPFFTTKADGQGSGLGLATVFSIVTNHGGTVSAQTSGRTRGTAFTVSLPRGAGAQVTRTDPPTPGALPDARMRLCILLVEDQSAVRRSMEYLLRDRGHEVLSAASFDEARTLFREHGDRVSLVLSDVSLDCGCTGPVLAEALRAQRQDIPVIFMSGNDHALQSLPLKTGHDFLQKPFSAEALYELLERRFGG